MSEETETQPQLTPEEIKLSFSLKMSTLFESFEAFLEFFNTVARTEKEQFAERKEEIEFNIQNMIQRSESFMGKTFTEEEKSNLQKYIVDIINIYAKQN